MNHIPPTLREAATLEAPPAGASPVVPPVAAAPITPPVAATPPASVLEGAKAPTDGDWLKTLPAELQSNQNLSKFKDVAALAKSYIDVQPLIGGEKIPKPSEKWGDSDWQAHYQRLGRPDTADKYTDPKDAKLPEGMAIDPAGIKGFREAAHKAGLTDKQYQAALAFYMGDMGKRFTEQSSAMQQTRVDSEATLKSEWGGKYEQNLTMANQALIQLGGEQLQTSIKGNPIMNDPHFIKMLHKLAVMTSEDTTTGGGPRVILAGEAQAKAQIEAKKADKTFTAALLSRQDPGHAAAKAEWNRLHKIAFPGTQAHDA